MKSPTKTLIVRYLDERGELSPHQLAALVGIDRRNINHALKALSAPPAVERLAHIGKWGRRVRGSNGSVAVALWVAGPGAHAKKPRPKTNAQKARASRARRAAPDRMLERLLVMRRPEDAHAEPHRAAAPGG